MRRMASTWIAGVGAAMLAVGCNTSDATVENYQLCDTATDTCPSATSCIGFSALSPTFCTRTCNTDSDCPDDASGNRGVCVAPPGVGYASCFQSCPGDMGVCPDGEACTMTVDNDPQATPVNACEPPGET